MKTFKIILICIFSATLAFVAFRSSLRGTKAIYETTQPQYREIKEEINISGNVFPMKEIEIKSQISGVLDKINVSIGDKVRIGDPVASISLITKSSHWATPAELSNLPLSTINRLSVRCFLSICR